MKHYGLARVAACSSGRRGSYAFRVEGLAFTADSISTFDFRDTTETQCMFAVRANTFQLLRSPPRDAMGPMAMRAAPAGCRVRGRAGCGGRGGGVAEVPGCGLASRRIRRHQRLAHLRSRLFSVTKYGAKYIMIVQFVNVINV